MTLCDCRILVTLTMLLEIPGSAMRSKYKSETEVPGLTINLGAAYLE